MNEDIERRELRDRFCGEIASVEAVYAMRIRMNNLYGEIEREVRVARALRDDRDRCDSRCFTKEEGAELYDRWRAILKEMEDIRSCVFKVHKRTVEGLLDMCCPSEDDEEREEVR